MSEPRTPSVQTDDPRDVEWAREFIGRIEGIAEEWQGGGPFPGLSVSYEALRRKLREVRMGQPQTDHANVGAGGGDESITLECDHCGDIAIRSGAKGFFIDGEGHHCESCGFPGHASVYGDDDDPDENPIGWCMSEDLHARCASALCEECSRVTPALPIVERGLRFLLSRIGSWTTARFDQHLRFEFGDEQADEVMTWLAEHVSPMLGKGENGEPRYMSDPRSYERRTEQPKELHPHALRLDCRCEWCNATRRAMATEQEKTMAGRERGSNARALSPVAGCCGGTERHAEECTEPDARTSEGKTQAEIRAELLSPISDEEWAKREPAETLRNRAAWKRGEAARLRAAEWPGKNAGAAEYNAKQLEGLADDFDRQAKVLDDARTANPSPRAESGLAPFHETVETALAAIETWNEDDGCPCCLTRFGHGQVWDDDLEKNVACPVEDLRRALEPRMADVSPRLMWEADDPRLAIPRDVLRCESDDGRPRALKDADPQFRAADEAMHLLWTWAVGLPGYDKKKWQALETAILALARRTPQGKDKS